MSCGYGRQPDGNTFFTVASSSSRAARYRRCSLLVDNHPVAVADCGQSWNFGLEYEELAVTYQAGGQGKHILHGLLGGDGTARCNSSNQERAVSSPTEIRQLGRDEEELLRMPTPFSSSTSMARGAVAANVAHGLETTELVSDRG